MRGAAYEDSTHGITHFLKKRSETQVSNKTILEMKHINKSFPGVRALQDVDFTLCGGEIHALMGENGAGKSTLIKVLTGVYEKDDGQIFVEGNDKEVSIRSPQDAQRLGISTVYQEITLCPNLSVAENMYIGRTENIYQDWKKMNADADKLLRSLDIPAKATQQLASCSIAVQQMVAIARAVDMDCKVLILDEPTAGLDPKGRDDILGLVQKLHNEQGLTIILVSHSMEDVARYVSRLVVMNHGEKVFDGTPKEVFRHYKELEAIGLAAPQITYVVHKLIDKGIPLDPDITTVEEAKNAILKIWREKNGKSSGNAAQVSAAGADSENAGHGNASGTASGKADSAEKTAGEEKTC